MKLTSVISTLAVLFGSSAAANSNYGPSPIAKKGFQNVLAHADLGFYAFSFGGPKTYAYQSFQFKLHDAAWLAITDCFCPGDTFQVFDNGVPIAVTVNDPNAPMDCDVHYDDNAWSCLVGNNGHAKKTVFLNPGHHNITIAAINSVYGGGTGFIRVDTSCTPKGLQPLPCCWIAGVDENNANPDPNYTPTAGRLCNQMVTYP